MNGGSVDRCVAVVLAGGASRRFGSDKLAAPIGDLTVLASTVGSVAPLVDEVVVIGPWAPEGITHVVEPERFQGPLAALAYALTQVSAAHVLVVGGDHPHVSPALLELLWSRRHEGDAVVPVVAGRSQPLVACYSTTIVDTATRLLAGGERRMTALLEQVAVVAIADDQWRAVDPSGRSFRDVDTVDDLRGLQADPYGDA